MLNIICQLLWLWLHWLAILQEQQALLAGRHAVEIFHRRDPEKMSCRDAAPFSDLSATPACDGKPGESHAQHRHRSWFWNSTADWIDNQAEPSRAE